MKAIRTDPNKDRIIRAIIKSNIELQGMNIPKLAKITGIPASTLYQRLQTPCEFRVSELRIISQRLKMNAYDRSQLVDAL